MIKVDLSMLVLTLIISLMTFHKYRDYVYGLLNAGWVGLQASSSRQNSAMVLLADASQIEINANKE